MALQQSNATLAAQHLRRALTISPGSAIYHCNLAVALRQLHRYAESIAASRQAVRLQPGYVAALVNLGSAHFAAEQYEQALAAFDQALERDADLEVVHAYRADTLRGLGRIRAAIQSYKRALELDADLHHAVGNLGITMLAVGQPERGLQLCRRATELAPQEWSGWMNLGTAFRRLGHLEDAMEAYASAYELNANEAELCTLIGEVWQETSDVPQAIGWFERALEIEPQRVQTLCGMAAATGALGDAEGAVAKFREIVTEHPDHGEARLGLGLALWADGDADAAIHETRQAVTLLPESARARAELATILASAGDVDAANEANRKALEINPRCLLALANLAQNLRGKLPATDAEQMERLLKAPWVTEGPRATLHFGLAHYYDGSLEYEQAAQHLAQANSLHTTFKSQRGWHYDPDEHAQRFDRIIDTFSAGFFARTAGMGNSSRVPIFIVGMPRSGTTLTEQILASHPRVFGAGERSFASHGFRSLAGLIRQSGDPLDVVDQLHSDLVQQVSKWHLEQLCQCAVKAGCAETDYDHVADKMPDNYILLGWIVTAFPQAKIIHCRRDVRDIAVSCWVTQFKELRWAFDLEHIAERILQYQRLMDHWRRTLPVPVLEIDYEETVANQEAQTARLLEFVELPWDARCLSFHQTERLVRTASVTQVRQPIYDRSVERWRRYKAQIEPLLERLAMES